MKPRHKSYSIEKGFSLIELITIMIIVGVLAATASSRLIPSASYQLQSSRDLILNAFFSAQQRAMNQADNIRLITTASSVDIRQDSNNNGDFTDDGTLTIGGVSYPVSLLDNQTLTAATFNYDRLGQTSSSSLSLTQSGGSVTINVTLTGYAY